jgi:hypothetical protein
VSFLNFNSRQYFGISKTKSEKQVILGNHPDLGLGFDIIMVRSAFLRLSKMLEAHADTIGRLQNL